MGEQKELQRKIEAEQKELQRNIETKQEKLRNIENQGNEAGEKDNLQKVEIQKKIPLVEVKKEIEWSKEEQEILHRAEAHGKKPAESNRLGIDQPEKQQVKSHGAPMGNIVESALNGLKWDSHQAKEHDEVNVVDSFFKNEAIKIRGKVGREKRKRWTNIERNAQRWAKINKEREIMKEKEQNKKYMTKHAQQMAELKHGNERQVKEEQEKRRQAEEEKQKAEEREKLRQVEEQRK